MATWTNHNFFIIKTQTIQPVYSVQYLPNILNFFNFETVSFKVGYLSPFVLFLTLPAENKAKLEGGSPHAMRLVTMGSPREAGLCEMWLSQIRDEPRK